MRGLGGGDEEDSRKWLGRLSEASENIWVLSSGPVSASLSHLLPFNISEIELAPTLSSTVSTGSTGSVLKGGGETGALG